MPAPRQEERGHGGAPQKEIREEAGSNREPVSVEDLRDELRKQGAAMAKVEENLEVERSKRRRAEKSRREKEKSRQEALAQCEILTKKIRTLEAPSNADPKTEEDTAAQALNKLQLLEESHRRELEVRERDLRREFEVKVKVAVEASLRMVEKEILWRLEQDATLPKRETDLLRDIAKREDSRRETSATLVAKALLAAKVKCLQQASATETTIGAAVVELSKDSASPESNGLDRVGSDDLDRPEQVEADEEYNPFT